MHKKATIASAQQEKAKREARAPRFARARANPEKRAEESALHHMLLRCCVPKCFKTVAIAETRNYRKSSFGDPFQKQVFTLEVFDLLSSLTFDSRTLKHVVIREKPKCIRQW